MGESAAPLPRYDAFEIHDVTYKTVKGHPIGASVLLPKDVRPGQHPLLVRFHGGGLVEGVRLGDWFRPWILDFCAAESAIVVTPDYRLLPEATGYDILDDLRDFWAWIAERLSGELHDIKHGLAVDLATVAVSGESAGAYLAAQSFLVPGLMPPSVTIRALLLQGPILDLESYTKPARMSIFDLPLEPKDQPERLLKQSPPGTIFTSHEPCADLRFRAAISMFQNGTLVSVLEGKLQPSPPRKTQDEHDLLWPTRNLSKLVDHLRHHDGHSAPALWLVSGWSDCMVPQEGTFSFALEYRRTLPGARVLLDFYEGDHGFDSQWETGSAEVRRGMDFVKRYWLGRETPAVELPEGSVSTYTGS